MSEGQVWECDDLKKYIFSFLRKTPRLICNCCNKVLIWDKKVCDFYGISENGDSMFDNKYSCFYKCIPCWKKDMLFLTWSGT